MAALQVECKVCGLRQRLPRLPEGRAAACARCNSELARRDSHGRRKALAFSLAALILYLPANLYPVLSMTYLGRYSENTLWSGVVEMAHSGMWGVAVLVFAASIAVPLLKLLVMFYLLWFSRERDRQPSRGHRVERLNTRLLQLVERIGPWSMLDVFLVAILVALVQMGDMAHVSPEPGLVAFAAVVVLTMLASASFDASALWQHCDATGGPGREARRA